MTRDPVCGMEIKDAVNAPAMVYKGKTYFFCTDLCKIQFEHEPGKYIKLKDKKDDVKMNPHHHVFKNEDA